MDSPDNSSQATAAHATIVNFSHCHDDIVEHLRTMSGLPELAAHAGRARRVAEDTRDFFSSVIYNHHREEERLLFEAVLAGAAQGEEFARVKTITDRLTRQHRKMEAMYVRIEPDLGKMAKGLAGALDPAALAALVSEYSAHAAFEESELLPLSNAILSRPGAPQT